MLSVGNCAEERFTLQFHFNPHKLPRATVFIAGASIITGKKRFLNENPTVPFHSKIYFHPIHFSWYPELSDLKTCLSIQCKEDEGTLILNIRRPPVQGHTRKGFQRYFVRLHKQLRYPKQQHLKRVSTEIVQPSGFD